ncbi:MAG TPA: hypothetical protein VN709_06880 [Terriglobales bacterium]|nr:hypothetical protein [Terriglobales bacterium]
MPAKTAGFDLATAAAFAPTSNQRRLINAIHDYPSVRTVREFCEHCDISRTTYYNWCKNPVFRLWFATAWSARLLTEGTTLINQARAKSSYKFPYWKALADLIFDPHGLALLQKWRQAMFTLDGSAFDCGPEAAPDYDHHLDPASNCDDCPPQNSGNDVNPPPDARVANPVQSLTLRAPFSTPHTANDSVAILRDAGLGLRGPHSGAAPKRVARRQPRGAPVPLRGDQRCMAGHAAS